MYVKLFQVFYPQDYRNQKLPETLPLKAPSRIVRWHYFGASNLFGVFIRSDSPLYNEVLSLIDFRFCHTYRFSHRGLYNVLYEGVRTGWRIRDVGFDEQLDPAAQRVIRTVLRSAEALQESSQREFLLHQVGLCLRAFERDRATRLQCVCLSKDGTHLHVYRNGLMYINRRAGLPQADTLLAASMKT